MIQPPSESMMVSLDRNRFTRVLRNLSENAAHYTPANSDLEIKIESDSQKIRVSYCNSAAELRPADLPFIFERFYRGEKSRSRQHGGAGIGLAIVKELVEAHGGDVFAEMADKKVCIGFSIPKSQ